MRPFLLALLALWLPTGLASAQQGCSAQILALLEDWEPCRRLGSGILFPREGRPAVLWSLYAAGGEPGAASPPGAGSATGVEIREDSGRLLLLRRSQPWESWFEVPYLAALEGGGELLVVPEALGLDRLFLLRVGQWLPLDPRPAVWMRELAAVLPEDSLPLPVPELDYERLAGRIEVRRATADGSSYPAGGLAFRLSIEGAPPRLQVLEAIYDPDEPAASGR